MMQKEQNKTMLTDLYQITMNAAYFDNKKDDYATFDLFVRTLPDDWGFFVANGIEDAIDYATQINFDEEDIKYLREQKLFKEEYLEFLKDFKFEGEIYALKEGTPIAANTPILRVTAKRTQAQFLETALLNTINFQTMIATKANRVVNAAKNAAVVEFGLRRGQEEAAAIKGARAAYIAGAVATSNVKAGQIYDIPISGTHAHSFVMSFDNEIDAFRAYVKTFPNNATLLIDTYDTINGAKNAVIVAKELEKKGNKLSGVRIDSGDICESSKKVREILDKNNLQYVKIIASNDLNEYKINEFIENGAKIDAYGVGTELITAKPVAAISGVYKIVEDEAGAKIKLSREKKTNPGKKQIYRIVDENENFIKDVLAIEGENIGETNKIPLLEMAVKNGKRVRRKPDLEEIKEYALYSTSRMPARTREIIAEPYELELSKGLMTLIEATSKKYGLESVINTP